MKFFIFIFIIINILFIYKFDSKKRDILDQTYIEYSNLSKSTYNKLLNDKKNNILSNTHLLSEKQNIIQNLIKKDYNIDCSQTIKDISKYYNLDDIWIQIIDKNGNSFYRSWTEKKGDNLLEFRKDIVKVFKDKKELNVVSSGKYDFNLKSISPIFDSNNQFIGVIEIISRFDSILEALKEKKISTIVVLNKKESKKIIKPYNDDFINNYYIANKNNKPPFFYQLDETKLEFLLEKSSNYYIEKNNIINLNKLYDVKGDLIGYVILSSKLTDLNYEKLYDFEKKILIIYILFVFIFILTYLIYLNKNNIKELNIELDNKNKKLQKNLFLYDSNVIYSKTDLNGIITEVSSAFEKISGYSKEEMIGKSHNIIRHPDMKKEDFEIMWKSLKSNKKIEMKVKNLKKDGGFYWVLAKLDIDYDEHNIPIGYTAIRSDITAEMEVIELTNEIEKTQEEIIYTMGVMGERKSKETGEHVVRVAEYSYLLAIKYGLTDKECELIKKSSPMHDIGKIIIPDNILNKSGKLTEEEFKIIQSHSQYGYDMLKHSNRELLKNAAIIAHEHHEKWNGNGYPRGLKGENIHIYGRITALADVFDALSSDRVYKKAWTDEKVFKYIEEQNGKQFEPKLVDIFFENLTEILSIRDKINKNEIFLNN